MYKSQHTKVKHTLTMANLYSYTFSFQTNFSAMMGQIYVNFSIEIGIQLKILAAHPLGPPPGGPPQWTGDAHARERERAAGLRPARNVRTWPLVTAQNRASDSGDSVSTCLVKTASGGGGAIIKVFKICLLNIKTMHIHCPCLQSDER